MLLEGASPPGILSNVCCDRNPSTLNFDNVQDYRVYLQDSRCQRESVNVLLAA